MLLNTKRQFWFSLQILSETFHIKRIMDRCVIKKTCLGLHVKYRNSCQIKKKTRIFWQSKNNQILNFTKIRPLQEEQTLPFKGKEGAVACFASIFMHPWQVVLEKDAASLFFLPYRSVHYIWPLNKVWHEELLQSLHFTESTSFLLQRNAKRNRAK